LMLVVGADVNIGVVFTVIGVCFVLVVLFGSQEAGQSFGAGVKAGLGGAFTTFLNTISSFGNVMSYIRLFAVGMASLAIAQSFNGMADSMLHGLALPAGILILVIGHALNIVMGMLSVVVHGMRLNLLEFSGQLGMEWAGIPYEPFKKNA
jgi:V/A-type H+/Na+-transporting ATPase subunit I